MSAPVDLPPLSIAREGQAITRATLSDGTAVETRLAERVAIVTLPSAETTARINAAKVKRLARAERAHKRTKAIALKREHPSRSIASIAREVGVSASSLGKWLRDAREAA